MCCIIAAWIIFTVPLTYVLLAIFREKDDAAGPLGVCEVCGYDLRATPDRCPECGTAPRHLPPHVRRGGDR